MKGRPWKAAAGGESETDPQTACPENWCRDFAPDEQAEDEGHGGGGGESEAGAGAFGHGVVLEPRVAYGAPPVPRVPLRLRGVAR